MPKKKAKESFLKKYLAQGSFDLTFFIIVIVLLCFGLVMLFSASYPYAYYKYGNSTHFFSRQLIFAGIGLVAMIGISYVKHDYFRIFALIGIVVAFLLLVIVLFTPEVKAGFHRWLYIPGMGTQTIQPSEIAKLALILFCAWGMDKEHKRIVGKNISKGPLANKIHRKTGGKIKIYESMFPTLVYGGSIIVFSGLVYLENHVSGTILMLAIGVIMLYLGGFKRYWFIIGGSVAVIAVIVFVTNPHLLEQYAGDRITAWLDKDYSPMDKRWQINQALYAIGSGGFLGTGLGNSKQKYMYVSEPQNDMIFAIVSEELGFIGAVILIILFALLVWRGVVIGLHSKDRFGALLAMGMVFQVGLQTALNIAVATDTVPNTGISLPFFSYGGTSLMILMFEMGMVLSVSRYSRLSKK